MGQGSSSLRPASLFCRFMSTRPCSSGALGEVLPAAGVHGTPWRSGSRSPRCRRSRPTASPGAVTLGRAARLQPQVDSSPSRQARLIAFTTPGRASQRRRRRSPGSLQTEGQTDKGRGEALPRTLPLHRPGPHHRNRASPTAEAPGLESTRTKNPSVPSAPASTSSHLDNFTHRHLPIRPAWNGPEWD